MQRKVWFENNKGQKLAGILHIPKGKGPFPAVIVCHGFKGYKDQKMMVEISRALAKAGILAFRFDFAGSGESEGSFKVMSIVQEVRDLHSAIKFVKNLKNTDKNKIGLTAHSLGGSVCIMQAAEEKNIRTLALVAPVVDRRGWIKEYIRQAKLYRYDRFFLLNGRRLPNNFIKKNTFAIYNLARKIRVPLLIIQGDRDQSSATYPKARRFIARIKGVKKLVRIRNGDHMFTKKKDFNRMISLTVNWFKKYLI